VKKTRQKQLEVDEQQRQAKPQPIYPVQGDGMQGSAGMQPGMLQQPGMNGSMPMQASLPMPTSLPMVPMPPQPPQPPQPQQHHKRSHASMMGMQAGQAQGMLKQEGGGMVPMHPGGMPYTQSHMQPPQPQPPYPQSAWGEPAKRIKTESDPIISKVGACMPWLRDSSWEARCPGQRAAALLRVCPGRHGCPAACVP